MCSFTLLRTQSVQRLASSFGTDTQTNTHPVTLLEGLNEIRYREINFFLNILNVA